MSAPLDSRQLRAFSMLARTGSFTLAARQLHLSQSAVSHAIKALENEVGCRLLDRLGRNVTLTHAGEALLARADRALAELALAREELQRLRQWGHGRLRVGASTTACEYLLPAVLREFKESFPHCAIMIEPGDTGATLDLLRAHRVDLVLALEPVGEPQLEFRPLFGDELQFIVSPLHPWAQQGRLSREDIRGQNYVLYNRKSHTFRLINRYFEQERIELRSCIELGSMEAIKQLVKIGLGVSIMAPWICREELAEGSLVALPLGKRKLKRRWGVSHWRARQLNLPEETFIGLCRSAAENLQTLTAEN